MKVINPMEATHICRYDKKMDLHLRKPNTFMVTQMAIL
jgi:hypothetical protein